MALEHPNPADRDPLGDELRALGRWLAAIGDARRGGARSVVGARRSRPWGGRPWSVAGALELARTGIWTTCRQTRRDHQSN